MQSPGGVPEVFDEVPGSSLVLMWSVVGIVSAMLHFFCVSRHLLWFLGEELFFEGPPYRKRGG